MKITAVKTVVVNAEMRNWVFVKVETSEPGLVGWGEASLEWKTRSVVGAVEDLAPMIIGEDPRRIEHLYQKMYACATRCACTRISAAATCGRCTNRAKRRPSSTAPKPSSLPRQRRAWFSGPIKTPE